jgi:thioesterase domain-containing protein
LREGRGKCTEVGKGPKVLRGERQMQKGWKEWRTGGVGVVRSKGQMRSIVKARYFQHGAATLPYD